MAEVKIQELPELPEPVLSTDLLNVQRHDGSWANYKTTVGDLTGIPTLIYEEVFDMAFLFGGVTALADPGASNVYLITSAWAKYTPGDTNPDQIVRVVGGWYDSNQAFAANLRSSPNGSIAPMYWELEADQNYASDRAIVMTCLKYPGGIDPPDGDGTITVHIEYAIVSII